jgi:hypothetical protein
MRGKHALHESFDKPARRLASASIDKIEELAVVLVRHSRASLWPSSIAFAASSVLNYLLIYPMIFCSRERHVVSGTRFAVTAAGGAHLTGDETC